MKRRSMNSLVDALSFGAFVLLTATGVLIRYILPPGTGRFSTLWGLDRHEWGQIHFWIAVVLSGALAIHLFLHAGWVVCMVKGRPREGSGVRVALAAVGLLALAGLAISPFFGSVEQAGEPPHKLRSLEHQRSDAYLIDGSMTLQEVAKLTGVPAADILRELGLPPGIPTDQRLGVLRKTYGFEMQDVRQIIQRHTEER